MKFLYTIALFFTLMLIAFTNASSSCPSGFKTENGKCTAQRPIHGTCPSGSNYQANLNKCVYGS